jgi:hypothetical protein
MGWRMPPKEFRMQSALKYLTTYGWVLSIASTVEVALSCDNLFSH